DLDLIVIFKGQCLPDEADRLRQLRQIASQLAGMRLDLAPRCEAVLLAHGSTGLKLGGKLVFGDDIRAQIPWEPIEQYTQDARQAFLNYQHEIRGKPDTLLRPVTAPDPAGEFFGY